MTRNAFLRLLFLLGLAVLGTAALRAQDTTPLHPPKGSKVALVVFEDLQCPDCARAHPLLVDAEKTYKIPLVVHDFPLPQHNWSFEAAVIARYLEKQNPKLSADYRSYIFEHQQEITPQNLRSYSDKFAQEHGVQLPFVLDPQGTIANGIRADKTLGERVGIQHTPTIYVVSNARSGKPFIEVVDRSQLFQLIDQVKSEAE